MTAETECKQFIIISLGSEKEGGDVVMAERVIVGSVGGQALLEGDALMNSKPVKLVPQKRLWQPKIKGADTFNTDCRRFGRVS